MGGEAVNFIELVGHATHIPSVLVGTWFVMILLLIFGYFGRRSLVKCADPSVPDDGVTLRSFSETIVEGLDSFVQDTIGTHNAREFVPFFTTLFIFLLAANFLGLVPGMEPPTNNSDLTFGLGGLCFIFYLWQGFRARGIGYLKSFLGPLVPLIPLMIIIEVVDNIFRPFSLGIRLFANMFADHTLLGLFTHLTYVIIPLFFYALGAIVCIVQAGVFVILAMAYVRMATSEGH